MGRSSTCLVRQSRSGLHPASLENMFRQQLAVAFVEGHERARITECEMREFDATGDMGAERVSCREIRIAQDGLTDLGDDRPITGSHAAQADSTVWIPLEAPQGSFTMLIDRTNGRPVDALPINPW